MIIELCVKYEVSCPQLTSFSVGGQMAKKEEIESGTEALLEPILDEFGFELWDVDYVREGKEYYLRVYIDKEGGITIDDCVEVSRRLSDELDAKDFIEDAYTLEVSSPGLGRRLVKEREFARSVGRDIDIKFYKPVDGSKELTGKLAEADAKSVTVEIQDSSGESQMRTFDRKDIASVKLSVDF